jgi:hypothetical protein
MMMNFPLEAWHVEKIRESVSEFGKFIVWNRDASNRARILVKIRVPDMLEIPISHVLCENTNDSGHGHSWTVVNYILQANLIEGLGGDDDPLPPEGGNPHPLPNLPFGGIWEDADFVHNMMHDVAPPHVPAAPVHGHAAPAAPADVDHIPVMNTPPQNSPDNNPILEDFQPAVEAMEAFDAIHRVIGNLMEGFHEIPSLIEMMEHTSVDGAGFKLLEVVDGENHEKKAIFTIYTSSSPPLHQSKCCITELEEDNSSYTESSYNPIDDHVESDNLMTDEEEICTIMTATSPAPKKQKKIVKDVTEVRRSNRIAKLCDGFKDKNAADLAKACMAQSVSESDNGGTSKIKKMKKTQGTKKIIKKSFSASVIDTSAPPPPELSIDNVQAIGVGQCKISPEELSVDKLCSSSG